MRIKSILLLILLSKSLISWAQRPMTIDVLQPKVDSIQMEMNQIYNRIQTAHKLFTTASKLNLNYSNFILISNGDTTIGLLINSENECILEEHFKSSPKNPIHQNSEKRKLTEEESALLNLKINFQEESNKKKYEIANLKNCFLHPVLLPYEKGYKFYVLTLSNQDSVIHFGNDYLFNFDYSAKLKSWKKIRNYKLISIKKGTNGLQTSGEMAMLWIGNSPSSQLPEAVNFIKFRLYHQHIKLDHCKSFCNKREFTYNALDNKISIKLFPNERK